MSSAPVAVVGVIGHAELLNRPDGAAAVLSQLGAAVRTLDLWEDPAALIEPDALGAGVRVRALVFEALDRPDLAATALRSIKKEPLLADVGALVAVNVGQVPRLDPATGFDDFVLHPYVPEELYARIRALEWRRSEFAIEERHKVGRMVVDPTAHEVSVDGRAVELTPREFGLLVELCEARGKLLSREHLLARVWGVNFEGGARTVDVHVRRLRAKLGNALPLVTIRGRGYKLLAPGHDAAE